MSAREIIEQLPKLTADELKAISQKLGELTPRPAGGSQHWGAALLELAGTAQGLPPDLADNHDQYLYGTPMR